MENNLVSILIITMNHEKFIEQACLSAINQTYENKEIIFLDNNSTDKTFEIAKEILEKSSISYKIIKNEKSYGVSKNLNTLVSNASGYYAAILSGDDWWEATLVEEKVKFIETGYDFVLSDGYKFMQETKEFFPAYNDSEKKKIIDKLPIFFKENLVENKTVNVGTFIKKHLLVKYPFDENINTEDWDMNLRMSFLGYKIGFVDKKLFNYRVLNTSLSRKLDIMYNSYQKVTSKYLDIIKSDEKVYNQYKINHLKFEYEILLNNTHDTKTREKLKKEWNAKKYKIKYKQPILFLKLLINNLR